MSSAQVLEDPASKEELLKIDPHYFTRVAALAGIKLKKFNPRKLTKGTFKSEKLDSFRNEYLKAEKRMEIVRCLNPDLYAELETDFNKCVSAFCELAKSGDNPEALGHRSEYKQQLIEFTGQLEKVNKKIDGAVDSKDKHAKECLERLVDYTENWGTSEAAAVYWTQFKNVQAQPSRRKEGFENLASQVKQAREQAERDLKQYEQTAERVREKLEFPTNWLGELKTKVVQFLDGEPEPLSVTEKKGFLARLDVIDRDVAAGHDFLKGKVKCETLESRIGEAVEAAKQGIKLYADNCRECERHLKTLQEKASVELHRRREAKYQVLRQGLAAGFQSAAEAIAEHAEKVKQDVRDWNDAPKAWTTAKSEFAAEIKQATGLPFAAQLASEANLISKIVDETKDYRRGVERLAELRDKISSFTTAPQEDQQACQEARKAYERQRTEALKLKDKLEREFGATPAVLAGLKDPAFADAELQTLQTPDFAASTLQEWTQAYSTAEAHLAAFCQHANAHLAPEKQEHLKNQGEQARRLAELTEKLEALGKKIERIAAAGATNQMFETQRRDFRGLWQQHDDLAQSDSPPLERMQALGKSIAELDRNIDALEREFQRGVEQARTRFKDQAEQFDKADPRLQGKLKQLLKEIKTEVPKELQKLPDELERLKEEIGNLPEKLSDLKDQAGSAFEKFLKSFKNLKDLPKKMANELKLLPENVKRLLTVELPKQIDSLSEKMKKLQDVKGLTKEQKERVAELAREFKAEFEAGKESFKNDYLRKSRLYESLLEEKKRLQSVIDTSDSPDAVEDASRQMNELMERTKMVTEKNNPRWQEYLQLQDAIERVEGALDDSVIEKYCPGNHERLSGKLEELRQMAEGGGDSAMLLKALGRLQQDAAALASDAREIRGLKRTLHDKVQKLQKTFKTVHDEAKKIEQENAQHESREEVKFELKEWEAKLTRLEHTLSENRTRLALSSGIDEAIKLADAFDQALKDKQQLATAVGTAVAGAQEDASKRGKWETAYKSAYQQWEETKKKLEGGVYDKKGVDSIKKQYLEPANKLAKAGDYDGGHTHLGLARRYCNHYLQYPAGDKYSTDLKNVAAEFTKQWTQLETQIVELGKAVGKEIDDLLKENPTDQDQQNAPEFKKVASKLEAKSIQPGLLLKEGKELVAKLREDVEALSGTKLDAKSRLDRKERCLQKVSALNRLLPDPLLLHLNNNPFRSVAACRGVMLSLEKLETQLLAFSK